MATHSLLLDGYNLAFRSYYAVPELSRSDGMPTNAIHGWVRTLWRLIDTTKPTAIWVFFDLGGSSRRLALLPDYKGNRSAAPENFTPQVEPMKALARAMGIPVIETQGVEADDVLASAAIRLRDEGHRVSIVSADKDFAQIVHSGIEQLLPPPTANPKVGWRTLTEQGVFEKFGIRPAQIIDYLALVGDTSDNIPGLEGVGPKTAVKWLTEYGSLEGLLEKYLYIQPARFQPKLDRARERLRMNADLIRLETDLEVELPTGTPNRAELLRLLAEYEMQSLLKEAGNRYPPE